MQIGNLKEKKKEKIWILLQIPRTNETARGKKKIDILYVLCISEEN